MIHFVGAGPGAADLITLRGANLLKNADLIIYAGSLVSEELLTYAKPDCRCYNSAFLTLDQVMALCVENKAAEIVRLHTGDPCLYGAIREQMDRLRAMEIPFDICPGVSSFCGAAAALQAEYTLPGVSQSVVITRMSGRTPVPEAENIRALSSHKATMVIFLSAGMAERLQEALLCHYPPSTPAAVVYKATWTDEKIIRCALAELSQSMREQGISNHALILVGDLLGSAYELSKLYDGSFETAFRQAL
jgi:precorrin-4/cobalt-precorrin-4 C11-methyltransferase